MSITHMHSAIGCLTPIMSHELLKLKTTLWSRWRAAIEVFLNLDKKKSLLFTPNTLLYYGVMLSVLVSYAVDREFELRLGQMKDYKVGICCFSQFLGVKATCISVDLFEWAKAMKIQFSMLVLYKVDTIVISSSHWNGSRHDGAK